MRRALYAVTALLGLVVLAFALAVVLVDAQALTRPLARQASAALGQPIELGEIDLRLFPLPAARVRDVVVGDGPAPLATVDELRLTVWLLPLLVGQVVLGSLEIDAPRIQLELDPEGVPVLPLPAASPREEETGDVPAWLAIRSLEIREGSLSAGPWQVRDLRVDGALSLDGKVRLTIDASLDGLARLEGAEVELDTRSSELAWSAHGELDRLDLADLGERLRESGVLDAALSGDARASFRASGGAGGLEAGAVSFEASSLSLALEELVLEGPVALGAALGETWSLDLAGAELRQGEFLRKPRGEALALSGPLGPVPSLRALGEMRIDVGPNELRAELDLAAASPRLQIYDSTLELAPLAGWFAGEVRPLSGRVAVERLTIAGAADLRGELELAQVELALQHGTVSLSGPLRAEGSRIVAGPLRVEAGGESSTLHVSYDLSSERVELRGEASGVDVEPLVSALRGDSPLSGTLTGEFDLEGPVDLMSVVGSSSFEITEGGVRGFSMLESVLGELVTIPVLVAQLRGRDLTRYNEESFDRLAGRVRVERGHALVDELVVEYRHATATLGGKVELASGALDLSGRIVLSEELESEVTGETDAPAAARRRVIPITGVRGTISKPRVVLDRAAVSAALAAYTAEGVVREKLEERLGSEGAEIVEGFLEQFLRRDRDEARPGDRGEARPGGRGEP